MPRARAIPQPAEPDPAILEIARALARRLAREDHERALKELEGAMTQDGPLSIDTPPHP